MWSRSKSNYSTTTTGVDLQPICKGCTQIEILLDLHSSPARQAKPPVGPLPIHTDFADLAECAERCYTCRVFRQAVLSQRGTSEEAARVAEVTQGCPVSIRLRPATESANLAFKIQVRNHPGLSAVVETSPTAVQPLNLPATPHAKTTLEQAGSWLRECRQTHQQSCAALRWSSENPTRLIKIVSETELQLCTRFNGAQMRYVALTYAWGWSLSPRRKTRLSSRG
jgi:hypothetical protein